MNIISGYMNEQYQQHQPRTTEITEEGRQSVTMPLVDAITALVALSSCQAVLWLALRGSTSVFGGNGEAPHLAAHFVIALGAFSWLAVSGIDCWFFDATMNSPSMDRMFGHAGCSERMASFMTGFQLYEVCVSVAIDTRWSAALMACGSSLWATPDTKHIA